MLLQLKRRILVSILTVTIPILRAQVAIITKMTLDRRNRQFIFFQLYERETTKQDLTTENGLRIVARASLPPAGQ